MLLMEARLVRAFCRMSDVGIACTYGMPAIDSTMRGVAGQERERFRFDHQGSDARAYRRRVGAPVAMPAALGGTGAGIP